MMIKVLAVAFVILLSSEFGDCACERDRNVQFQNPLYLNYGDGFFYMWEVNKKLLKINVKL